MAQFTWTYTTLKAAIQSFTEDDSTEFSSALDDIIGLAEMQIYNDVDLDVLRLYADVSLTSGVRTASKPSGFLHSRWAYITVSSTLQFLRHKDTSWCYDFWPGSGTDVPIYYGDYNSTTFVIAPTPDSGYTMRLSYNAIPARLDSSTTTTWLTDNAPDVLLYACLLKASQFLHEVGHPQEPAMLTEWKTAYAEARERLRDEQMRRQRQEEARFGESRGNI